MAEEVTIEKKYTNWNVWRDGKMKKIITVPMTTGQALKYFKADAVEAWTNKNETMGKYKATIVFGEYAAKAYCNGGIEEMAEHMAEGQLTVREFDTEAERRAYIMGIDDSDGWLGAAVLSKEDAESETVKQLLDE
jgi:hypothetical protein